jgi:hypothetical protein
VTILQAKIRDDAGDMKNFCSYISQFDGYPITDKFLTEIKNTIKKKYSSHSDIVDIKAEPNNSLKIIGYKHNEVRIEIS